MKVMVLWSCWLSGSGAKMQARGWHLKKGIKVVVGQSHTHWFNYHLAFRATLSGLSSWTQTVWLQSLKCSFSGPLQKNICQSLILMIPLV